MDKLKSGKDYITEMAQDTSTDTGWAWIEGWICGYTDPDHSDILHAQFRDEMMNHLKKLQHEKTVAPFLRAFNSLNQREQDLIKEKLKIKGGKNVR